MKDCPHILGNHLVSRPNVTLRINSALIGYLIVSERINQISPEIMGGIEVLRTSVHDVQR
jgi:hypothetical protein